MGFISTVIAIGKLLWMNHKTRGDIQDDGTPAGKLYRCMTSLLEALMWNFVVMAVSLVLFLVSSGSTKLLRGVVKLCDGVMDNMFAVGGSIICGFFVIVMTLGLMFGYDITPKDNID